MIKSTSAPVKDRYGNIVTQPQRTMVPPPQSSVQRKLQIVPGDIIRKSRAPVNPGGATTAPRTIPGSPVSPRRMGEGTTPENPQRRLIRAALSANTRY